MNNVFIKIEGLKKKYISRDKELEVLKGIDLSIYKGDIFGIMGFSGAGKSTLVRCINRLEEPGEGSIIIDGADITKLSKKELETERQKIGMIFQDFNLFDAKTVFQNVEYPLKLSKMRCSERKARVDELLKLVGLSEKTNQYPSQLSGGQKQRIGIARALANNPKVLLCDEATSSLDPQTTLSVLDLLKEINQKYGLTIIMISHEIEVIKYACRHIAVIEDGLIAEAGIVDHVLSEPKSETAQTFLKVEERLKEEWKMRRAVL